MALVTVTGRALDNDRDPIPESSQPELWFRPLASTYGAALFTNREVQASWTNIATGEFSVQLESQMGLLYVPVVRWLVSSSGTGMEKRSFGYDEWKPFFPGQGGNIAELSPAVGLTGLLYGFDEPPERLENVIYLDIRGPKIRVHGPANSLVEV